MGAAAGLEERARRVPVCTRLGRAPREWSRERSARSRAATRRTSEPAQHIGRVAMVEVAVAVLERPDGAFLLAQRPQGRVYSGWWELPGGKIRAGGSLGAARARRQGTCRHPVAAVRRSDGDADASGERPGARGAISAARIWNHDCR